MLGSQMSRFGRMILSKRNSYYTFAVTKLRVCTSNSNKRNLSDLRDEPIRFTGSQADWKAVETFKTPHSNAPPYQTFCVVMSSVVFMIYFCILREENDVDDNLASFYSALDPYAEMKKLEKKLEQEMNDGTDTLATKTKMVALASRTQQAGLGALEASLKRIETKHLRKQQQYNDAEK